MRKQTLLTRASFFASALFSLSAMPAFAQNANQPLA